VPARVLCAVQTDRAWQTRIASRTLLGWRLGRQESLPLCTAHELIARLSSRGHHGVFAFAMERENLLVRIHDPAVRAGSFFPEGEELLFWSRKAGYEAAHLTETVGLRSEHAALLQRATQEAGFSSCLLFPKWIGAITGSAGAKPGTALEFHNGFLQKTPDGWSRWQRYSDQETAASPRTADGVAAALLGGLLLAIRPDVAPSGWASTRPAGQRRPRWLTAVGLVAAILIAFAGRWNRAERQIAMDRAVLAELRSAHRARSGQHGCTLSDLGGTLLAMRDAAQGSVSVSAMAYSSSDGLSLSGTGLSPSHVREFFESCGMTENTISFTSRDRDIFFQMTGEISCGH
jgi:hypothetical protein